MVILPRYKNFIVFKIQFLSLFLNSAATGRFALFQNGVEYDDDFDLTDSEDTSLYFDNWSMETDETFKALNEKNVVTYKIKSSYISTAMLEILLLNAGYDINSEAEENNSYIDLHNLVANLNNAGTHHIDAEEESEYG